MAETSADGGVEPRNECRRQYCAGQGGLLERVLKGWCVVGTPQDDVVEFRFSGLWLWMGYE